MSAHLVYLASQKGPPIAQKWFEPLVGCAGVAPLKQHALTADQAAMSLDDLARIFPPPKMEEP